MKRYPVLGSTADNLAYRYDNNYDEEIVDKRFYPAAAAADGRLRHHDDSSAVMLSTQCSVVYGVGGAGGGGGVTAAVSYNLCGCDVCHHCSVNTSLYPMIGSCTTSSCHVDSARPRPLHHPQQYTYRHGSGSTLTDCSTCCVYEYAMGPELGEADLDSLSQTTVDCGSAVRAASVSWSTVHSAPAVLGRLTRYKLPVSHRPSYNCTMIRHRHDDHERRVDYGRDRRDEFHCCPSDQYYPAANRHHRLSPSLRLAQPVLAETQYWV